jgi:predicted NBD/HSP70 family sugar kinase
MIICIDIGGITTRIGFSKNQKTFEKIVKFPTQDNFQNQVDKLTKELVIQTKTAKKIIIAAAGSVDKNRGLILKWGQNQPRIKYLQPIILINGYSIPENDANIAGLGEAVLALEGYHCDIPLLAAELRLPDL